MNEIMNKESMLRDVLRIKPKARQSEIDHIERRPKFRDALDSFLPLFPSALFMGVAYDNLPVLLNLADPSQGPLLVINDSDCGKSRILHAIVESATALFTPDQVLFAAITQNVEEWEPLRTRPNSAAIVSAQAPDMEDLLKSISDWAHSNYQGTQSILFLIDDFTTLMSINAESCLTLRQLLIRGPARRVWPIATIESSKLSEIPQWISFFRTHIFGKINNTRDIDHLVKNPGLPIEHIASCNEFMLLENDHWLKFWIPSID